MEFYLNFNIWHSTLGSLRVDYDFIFIFWLQRGPLTLPFSLLSLSLRVSDGEFDNIHTTISFIVKLISKLKSRNAKFKLLFELGVNLNKTQYLSNGMKKTESFFP